ncbi:GrpB family protein [Carnobacterium sp.]|uniref:GrpB family protein n=1 Tax=Carnobacterium sp. TaxID=48221 RepID=UPI00388D0084
MRKVEVLDYQTEWLLLFEKEKKILHQLFQKNSHTVFHIGSTAVPGLAAKPIIDLMPVVYNLHQVDTLNEEMEQLGYVVKGENGLTGRRYFEKGGDHRTHHVHLFQIDNQEITRHLAFRDYLRAHPKEAQRYGQLKKESALQYPNDITAYIEAKRTVLKEIEQLALHWYKTTK